MKLADQLGDLVEGRLSIMRPSEVTRLNFFRRNINENKLQVNQAKFGRQKELFGLLLAEQILGEYWKSRRHSDLDDAAFRLMHHFRVVANNREYEPGDRSVAIQVSRALARRLSDPPSKIEHELSEIEQSIHVVPTEQDWINLVGTASESAQHFCRGSIEVQVIPAGSANSGDSQQGAMDWRAQHNYEAQKFPHWLSVENPTKSDLFIQLFTPIGAQNPINEDVRKIIGRALQSLERQDFAAASSFAESAFALLGKTWSPRGSNETRKTIYFLRALTLLSGCLSSSLETRRRSALSALELLCSLGGNDDLCSQLLVTSVDGLQPESEAEKNEWATTIGRAVVALSADTVRNLLDDSSIATLTNFWTERLSEGGTKQRHRMSMTEIELDLKGRRNEAISNPPCSQREILRRFAQIHAQIDPLLFADEKKVMNETKEYLRRLVRASSNGDPQDSSLKEVIEIGKEIEVLKLDLRKSSSVFLLEVLAPFLVSIEPEVESANKWASDKAQPDVAVRLLTNVIPLGAVGGSDCSIQIELRNTGTAPARSVIASASADYWEPVEVSQSVENLDPGATKTVHWRGRLIEPCLELPLQVSVEFSNSFGQRFEIKNELIAENERESRWHDGDMNPYVTSPVQDARKLYGRSEQLEVLQGMLLQGESVFVTGQKRVGKSSLVTVACRKIASERVQAAVVPLGYLAAGDAQAFIRSLVSRISSLVNSLRPDIEKVEFDPRDPESTSMIAGQWLGKAGESIGNDCRVVLAIDDFDEITNDLLNDRDGAVLFTFIRAAVNERWLSLVFIGSEVLPEIIHKHAAKLNTFKRIDVGRIDSLEAMANLITEPSIARLDWSDDSVLELTNSVSGNPYFAVMVCENVWNRLRQLNRSYVTYTDVVDAINSLAVTADSTHFIHLWSDSKQGINPDSRESDVNALVLFAVGQVAGISSARREELSDWIRGRVDDLSKSIIEGRILQLLARGVLVERRDHSISLAIPFVQKWFVAGAEAKLGDRLRPYLYQSNQRNQISDIDVVNCASKLREAGEDVSDHRVGAWLDQFVNPNQKKFAFVMLQRLAAERCYGQGRVQQIGNSLRAKLETSPLWKSVKLKANGRSTANVLMISVFPEEEGLLRRLATGMDIPNSSVTNFADIGKVQNLSDGLVLVTTLFDGTGREVTKLLNECSDKLANLNGKINFAALTVCSQVADESFTQGDRVYERVVGELLRPEDDPLVGLNDDFAASLSEEVRESLIRQQENLLNSSEGGWGEYGLLLKFERILPSYAPAVFWSKGKHHNRNWVPLFEDAEMWSGSILPRAQGFIERLIRGGEFDKREFKSSLDVAVERGPAGNFSAVSTTKEIRRNLEDAVMKTLVGFSNSSGGWLLLGVADDGSIVGVDLAYKTSDRPRERDSFERKLRDLMKNRILDLGTVQITVHWEELDGRDVLAIEVSQGERPATVKDFEGRGKSVFFIRDGNRTSQIDDPQQLAREIMKRFPNFT